MNNKPDIFAELTEGFDALKSQLETSNATRRDWGMGARRFLGI